MKTFLLLCTLIVCSSLGEILSAKGMQQVGAVSLQPRALLGALWRMLRNPFLILGVVGMAVAFFTFISLLSYADLSFVVPLTAVSYITNTVGARFLLHERICRKRWLGTLLVAFGVALVSLSGQFENLTAGAASRGLQQFYWLLAPEEISNPAQTPLVFWTLFGVRLALLSLVMAACIYHSIALIAGLLWFADRRLQRTLDARYAPAATILKPVRGADAQAYENFAGFCRQAYPVYQIIFGVQDERDPVLPIIEKLRRDYPACDIEIVISPNEIGYNRKVSNLQNMLSRAKYDLLLISDSDIRVGPDYLRRVVAPLQQPQVGMVTCLYRGANATTLAGLLENIGISSTFGPEVCSARTLEGIKFALGSTIALRREVLAQIGGFPAVADYLADDFLLGKYAAAAGYEIVLSDYVVEHVTGPEPLSTMLKHQLRWGRSTRISRPWGYRGLILTYGTATALLALLAWQGGAFAWGLLAATLLIRALPAFVVGVIGLQDYVLAKWFWLLPLRDLLTFGIWIASFVGNEIHWRGTHFRVLPGGKLAPVGD